MATLAEKTPTPPAQEPAFKPTHWTQRLPEDALDHIPGDGGLPVVGNTFKMLADPPKFARDMVAKYGRVYKNKAFGGWQVAMVGAEANELMLFDRNKTFSSEQGWGPVLDQMFPHGLMLLDFDHHRADLHEVERGPGSFAKTLEGMEWLRGEGITMAVAGRTLWGESDDMARAGFAALYARNNFNIDAQHPGVTVLFPEMDMGAEVPEITTACWGILGKSPKDVMCASSRMVVRHKGQVEADIPGPGQEPQLLQRLAIVLAITVLAPGSRRDQLNLFVITYCLGTQPALLGRL